MFPVETKKKKMNEIYEYMIWSEYNIRYRKFKAI